MARCAHARSMEECCALTMWVQNGTAQTMTREHATNIVTGIACMHENRMKIVTRCECMGSIILSSTLAQQQSRKICSRAEAHNCLLPPSQTLRRTLKRRQPQRRTQHSKPRTATAGQRRACHHQQPPNHRSQTLPVSVALLKGLAPLTFASCFRRAHYAPAKNLVPMA